MPKLPDLTVTPEPQLPLAYAEVSGDHNPIHTDPEFARAAGLPGTVLHGLYTMALVARAACSGRAPLTLRAFAGQFRALAGAAEPITICCTAVEPREGRVVVEAEAHQGAARVIRRGRAEFDA